MKKSDVRELKKELKKAAQQDGIIDWVYGFYVTPDNEIAWEHVQKFYDYDEDEKFRYLGILLRVVSTGIGRDMIPVDVKQNEKVLAIREAWDKDEAATIENLKPLRDIFVNDYAHTDPYLATLFHVTYDVPGKASDGARLEDLSTVFDTVVFALCPAKLSAPALGFDSGDVAELSRRWTIGLPQIGFMYPSFDDRGETRNEAAFYLKKDTGKDVLNTLFDTEEISGASEDREDWIQVLTETGVSSETASAINDSIIQMEEDYISRDTLRKVVEESGGDGNVFDEHYGSVIGDREIAKAAISNSTVEIKTDSANIKAASEQAAFFRTKTIDGIEYILVPVDGVVTVNGVEVVTSGGEA
ncbi:MAG: DUF4317 family protein [Lachnospiraceae bacterium]|nr:DUF4317 family protein [Lachnospiraceae bacterium]